LSGGWWVEQKDEMMVGQMVEQTVLKMAEQTAAGLVD
jgi:hypothetical protein